MGKGMVNGLLKKGPFLTFPFLLLTFYLPVAAMQDERYAPLRILEELYHRPLA